MTDAEKVVLLRETLWQISEKMLRGPGVNHNWTKKIYYQAYDALKATADDPESYGPRIVEIETRGG